MATRKAAKSSKKGFGGPKTSGGGFGKKKSRKAKKKGLGGGPKTGGGLGGAKQATSQAPPKRKR